MGETGGQEGHFGACICPTPALVKVFLVDTIIDYALMIIPDHVQIGSFTRPVSVELWSSDKNQVKSCFKPHSRCSPPVSPGFNKVSSDKEVLWQEIGTQECARHYGMCVRSTFPQGLTHPPFAR